MDEAQLPGPMMLSKPGSQKLDRIIRIPALLLQRRNQAYRARQDLPEAIQVPLPAAQSVVSQLLRSLPFLHSFSCDVDIAEAAWQSLRLIPDTEDPSWIITAITGYQVLHILSVRCHKGKSQRQNCLRRNDLSRPQGRPFMRYGRDEQW